mgnify:CR=1 FL=1
MLGRLFALIMEVTPQHAISRVIHGLSRWSWGPWKNLLIRSFRRLYQVNTGEAVNSDPGAYPSFNAFFTRALAPGARTVDTTPNALLSPVDGAVSQIGAITEGRLIQAKRRDFSLAALLGGDPAMAARFADGAFATLYLSPRDYHRIHMPCAGELQQMLHVPGRLFGVSAPLVRHVPDLYARNERLVCEFDTAFGPMAMVLVGAIGVGSIETVWTGEVTPPRGQRIRNWDYHERPVTFAAGDEMGRFNLGSTVILLLPPQASVRWDEGLASESTVRLGQSLATYTSGGSESGLFPGEGDHGIE